MFKAAENPCTSALEGEKRGHYMAASRWLASQRRRVIIETPVILPLTRYAVLTMKTMITAVTNHLSPNDSPHRELVVRNQIIKKEPAPSQHAHQDDISGGGQKLEIKFRSWRNNSPPNYNNGVFSIHGGCRTAIQRIK